MEEKYKNWIFIILLICAFGFYIYSGYRISSLGEEFCSAKDHLYSGEYAKLEKGYGFMCYEVKGDYLVTEWVYYNKFCRYDLDNNIKSCDYTYYVDTENAIENTEVKE